jgi:hypothetical protein
VRPRRCAARDTTSIAALLPPRAPLSLPSERPRDGGLLQQPPRRLVSNMLRSAACLTPSLSVARRDPMLRRVAFRGRSGRVRSSRVLLPSENQLTQRAPS